MEAIEFIDIINPDHDRTSCDDENLNNGFYTRNGTTWHGRCSRCMMLEIISGCDVPKEINYSELNG